MSFEESLGHLGQKGLHKEVIECGKSKATRRSWQQPKVGGSTCRYAIHRQWLRDKVTDGYRVR
jgi:hypothetical protein